MSRLAIEVCKENLQEDGSCEQRRHKYKSVGCNSSTMTTESFCTLMPITCLFPQVLPQNDFKLEDVLKKEL